LSKFDGSTWTEYTTVNGLANNFVSSIAIDKQGVIWIGTDGGLSKFDGTNWTKYTEKNGLISNSINSVIIDAQGNKWIAAVCGVSKFDGINWTNYAFSNGQICDNVSSIAIDASNNVWVGTSRGVSRLDGSKWTSFTTVNGLADNVVLSAAADAQGNIWFGTNGGVSKYKGTINTVVSITNCDSFQSPSKKYIWYKTGLYRDTLHNYEGLDSTITINLTINKSFKSQKIVTTCDSFLLQETKKWIFLSGIYHDNFKTIKGCDSIVTYNVTIDKLDLRVEMNSNTLLAKETDATYQWLDCINNYTILPDDTNRSFTAKNTGTYAVKMKKGSCTDTSDCYIVTGVGITGIDDINFIVSPNPTSSMISINLGGKVLKSKITIMNSLGQSIYEEYNFSDNIDLAIQGLPGLYFIELQILEEENTRFFRKKIIKI
jgi:hypothetical protein